MIRRQVLSFSKMDRNRKSSNRKTIANHSFKRVSPDKKNHPLQKAHDRNTTLTPPDRASTSASISALTTSSKTHKTVTVLDKFVRSTK